jgi:cyclase
MTFRVIARLDVKPPNLVKGIHLEGFRQIGNPALYAEKYFKDGADEISYQDIVASLYDRNSMDDLVSETATSVFVPITVGGGIKSAEQAEKLVKHGADKVCINTGAINNPSLIEEIAGSLGSQAVVLGIEAKHLSEKIYTPMTDCGREHSGMDIREWVEKASKLGIGEIVLTSIDREGTLKGFDFELFSQVRNSTNVPIILHGGAGSLEDIRAASQVGADGVAIASLLHFQKATIREIKESLVAANVEVRL